MSLKNNTHPCEIIYNTLKTKPDSLGEEEGFCRITGKLSKGVKFNSWVKSTFVEWGNLYEGEIISNEALFCFSEVSPFLANLLKREKPQTFRTYHHIVTKEDNWLCLTKGDNEMIMDLIKSGAKIISLSSTGKKHIFFKHKIGFWQLDDLHIVPDVEAFTELHEKLMLLLDEGYNQKEIKTMTFKISTIKKIGIDKHYENFNFLKANKDSPLFDFTAFLLYKK